MKLDTTDSTVTVGNVPTGDVTESKISDAAMAHVTKLLRLLYNDPMLACFREYVANALDAHTKAGNPDPVDVMLPTISTPIVTFKDRGTGMSPDTLRTIFSQFGESTKNDSDAEIGGFGLGCKSGLAIASQFTIITTKDGIRSTAIFSNSEDGLSKLNIVDIREVEEPNGTSIAVPVDDVNLFNRKAHTYFPFFIKGSVRINGSLIPQHYSEKYAEYSISEHVSTEFNSTVSIFSGVRDSDLTGSYWEEASGVFLVMGGIPYNISSETMINNLDEKSAGYIKLFSSGVLMIMDAPVGAVKLSPNREGIQFNENTRRFFSEVFSSAISEYIEGTLERIQSAETYIQAVEEFNSIPDGITKGKVLEWNGISVKGNGNFSVRGRNLTVSRLGYERVLDPSGLSYSFNHTSSCAEIIYGTADPVTVRRYLGTYLREHGDSYRRILYFQVTKEDYEKIDEDSPFINSVVIAPTSDYGFYRNPDEEEYLREGDAEFQSLSFEQIQPAFEESPFGEVSSFDDMKKVVLRIRREAAKLARESPDVGGRTKSKTVYLTVSTDDSESSALTVDDIKELPSFVLVTLENIGKWDWGIQMLQRSADCNDVRIPDYLSTALSKAYKGQTLVFLTGSRSEAHARKLFKDVKIEDFEYDKLLTVLKKQLPSILAPKQYLSRYVRDALDLPQDAVAMIKDPALRKVLQGKYADTKDSAAILNHFASPDIDPKIYSKPVRFMLTRVGYVRNDDMEAYFGMDEVFEKYPLLKNVSRYNWTGESSKHLALYINAVHAKDKFKLFTNVFNHDNID